jgi:hypothetical protein
MIRYTSFIYVGLSTIRADLEIHSFSCFLKGTQEIVFLVTAKSTDRKHCIQDHFLIWWCAI